MCLLFTSEANGLTCACKVMAEINENGKLSFQKRTLMYLGVMASVENDTCGRLFRFEMFLHLPRLRVSFAEKRFIISSNSNQIFLLESEIDS